MKYEIGDQITKTEKTKVIDHYYLFVLIKNSRGGYHREYLTSQLHSHKIWLSRNGFVFIESSEGRKICDDTGYIDFKSVEDIKKWLDGSHIYVKVGFGDYRKKLSGFDHYQIPGVNINNLYVEREIHTLTDYEDAVHLIPAEEPTEGTGRVLKPGGNK